MLRACIFTVLSLLGAINVVLESCIAAQYNFNYQGSCMKHFVLLGYAGNALSNFGCCEDQNATFSLAPGK